MSKQPVEGLGKKSGGRGINGEKRIQSDDALAKNGDKENRFRWRQETVSRHVFLCFVCFSFPLDSRLSLLSPHWRCLNASFMFQFNSGLFGV